MEENKHVGSYATGLFFAYVGSLVSVSGLFVATMLVHYQRLDYQYLGQAVLPMLVVSVVPGIVGALLHRRSRVLQFLIGAILGPLAAGSFVILIS